MSLIWKEKFENTLGRLLYSGDITLEIVLSLGNVTIQLTQQFSIVVGDWLAKAEKKYKRGRTGKEINKSHWLHIIINTHKLKNVLPIYCIMKSEVFKSVWHGLQF